MNGDGNIIRTKVGRRVRLDLVLPRARCPYCDTPDPLVRKLLSKDDEAIVRRVRCRGCGACFIIIQE